MSNQLVAGPIVQGTSFYGPRPNQLVTGGSLQGSAQACVIDLTPPVFSGLSSVTLGTLGQIRAQWSAATDVSNPINYEVYIQANTSFGLFNVVNIAYVTTQLQMNIFADSYGNLLQNAVQYYVGVRAVDAVGNRDANTVSLMQISPGITGAISASISGIFNIDDLNQLIASFWVTDSQGVVDAPARLGTAAYVIYDRYGNLVPGMAQSGIAADAEGFFEITPIASVLDLDNNFYAAKVTITVDGVPLVYNLPVVHSAVGHQYEPRAVFSINASNQLQGTLWITKDSELYVDAIGVASYTIYDKDGNSIGITESGLSPDLNGYYEITPVNAAAILDLTHYVVKITILAAGENRVGTVGITLGE
ncbi:hypothetical protein EBZ38_05960 [bacterium]|nr:hypothetical protein [bacterium]